MQRVSRSKALAIRGRESGDPFALFVNFLDDQRSISKLAVHNNRCLLLFKGMGLVLVRVEKRWRILK